eukprot:GFUD01037175.1.p1 GENE.GFUD01037175.1~~GFUD01037175.1.p1  ORF type:complete len:283 (+),score=69.60 GFUD01037175.1:36-884(+)
MIVPLLLLLGLDIGLACKVILMPNILYPTSAELDEALSGVRDKFIGWKSKQSDEEKFGLFHQIKLDTSVCRDESSCLSAFPSAELAVLLSMANEVELDGLQLSLDVWRVLAKLSENKKSWIPQSFILSHSNQTICGMDTNTTESDTCNNRILKAQVAVLANTEEVELAGVTMTNCSALARALTWGLRRSNRNRRIEIEGSLSQECKEEVEAMAGVLGWRVEYPPGHNRIVINRCIRNEAGHWPRGKDQKQVGFWRQSKCIMTGPGGEEMVWEGGRKNLGNSE